MGKKYNLGLALSGGGARCTAELGILKCLEENDIKPDIISGTSGGAIVGGLYATGLPADEILTIFKKVNLFNISNYAFRKPGLIDIEKFRSNLEKYIPENDFSKLEMPLIISATELLKGKRTYFDSGDLIQCILASAAYPGVFSPVKINGSLYADGGILDNLPVEGIRDKCQILLAVNVNAIVEIAPSKIKTSLDVLNRALHLTVSNQQIMTECDMIIEPSAVGSYGIFSINKMNEIYQLGYDEAKKRLKDIKKLLKD